MNSTHPDAGFGVLTEQEQAAVTGGDGYLAKIVGGAVGFVGASINATVEFIKAVYPCPF